MLAAELLTEVGDEIGDNPPVRWPLDERLRYLNAGQRQIVVHKPAANSKRAAVKLAAGTYQTLPDDGVSFLKLVRNLGADGLTPGPGIRYVDWQPFQDSYLALHTDPADQVVRTASFDAQDPLHYWVYPAVPAAPDVYVDLLYGALPLALPLSTGKPAYDADFTLIGLPDIYAEALKLYICHRCFRKDTAEGDAARAARYFEDFQAALGIKIEVDAQQHPASREPFNERQPNPQAVR